MNHYSLKSLLAIASPYLITWLIVVGLFIAAAVDEGEGMIAAVLAATIFGAIGAGLAGITLLLLGEMLHKNKKALYIFAALESVAATAVLWFHILPQDAEVWMWALISIPYMLGIASAVILFVAAIVASVMRRKQAGSIAPEQGQAPEQIV